ncbi:hypothetical protein BaRGS_00004122, partial [Batillaria attramentaria]
ETRTSCLYYVQSYHQEQVADLFNSSVDVTVPLAHPLDGMCSQDQCKHGQFGGRVMSLVMGSYNPCRY